MSSACTTTTWVSGRKLSVVGLSEPEVSISVPVSAAAPNACDTATASLPSEGPTATPHREGQIVRAQEVGQSGRHVILTRHLLNRSGRQLHHGAKQRQPLGFV